MLVKMETGASGGITIKTQTMVTGTHGTNQSITYTMNNLKQIIAVWVIATNNALCSGYWDGTNFNIPVTAGSSGAANFLPLTISGNQVTFKNGYTSLTSGFQIVAVGY